MLYIVHSQIKTRKLTLSTAGEHQEGRGDDQRGEAVEDQEARRGGSLQLQEKPLQEHPGLFLLQPLAPPSFLPQSI